MNVHPENKTNKIREKTTAESHKDNMQRLEEFIINNQGLIKGLESTARVGVTFSMKEDSELFIETVTTAMNILDSYNEHLLTKYKRINAEIIQDKRFGPLFKVNQFTKVIQHVSMLIEMYVSRSPKFSQWKWPIIFTIEIVRAFLKLLAVVKTRNATQTPIYIHHSLLPSDGDFHIERTEILRQELNDDSLSSSATIRKIGSRSGKSIPNLAVHGKVPKPDAILLKPYDGRVNRGMTYLAEILHAIRPVVYVTCLYKYGPRSWKPWLVSLFFDLASEAILYRLDQRETGKCVEAERQRRFSFMNYIFKSPLFELVLKPFIEWFCRVFRFPLISGLISK